MWHHIVATILLMLAIWYVVKNLTECAMWLHVALKTLEVYIDRWVPCENYVNIISYLIRKVLF